jgi:hypothetical protein
VAGRIIVDVVDGVIFAWLRVTALHQDPHVVEPGRGVFDGVNAPLELSALSAELCQQPAEDLIWAWSTHMDVVQPVDGIPMRGIRRRTAIWPVQEPD